MRGRGGRELALIPDWDPRRRTGKSHLEESDEDPAVADVVAREDHPFAQQRLHDLKRGGERRRRVNIRWHVAQLTVDVGECGATGATFAVGTVPRIGEEGSGRRDGDGDTKGAGFQGRAYK